VAIQHRAVIVGGIEVLDAYTRTRAVNVIRKDRVGGAGIYATYECETFKDAAAAESGTPLPLEGGNLGGKIRNIEALDGLTGNFAADAFGVLYEDAKTEVVERGWEVSTEDVEDV